MIYSTKHKFLFVRNPACANRSIAEALRPFADDYEEKGFGWKHCTYMKQKSSDKYNLSHMFEDYFVFTGVRNPWERAYNLFEGQRIMNVVDRNFNDQMDRNCTDWNAECKTLNDNLSTLTDNAILILNQKDYRVGVDFVYRFENLDVDFQVICEMIGIDARLPPKEESYAGIDFKDETFRWHYNQNSIDVIAEINKDDIREYGYTFEIH